MRTLLFCWFLSSLLLLTACNPDFSTMAERRLTQARQLQDTIEIVVIKSAYEPEFLDGVLLAAEQINSRPGKLLGRTLKVHIEEESDSIEGNKSMLRRIVANPRITAVLGHPSSSIAIPASMIYELSQMIFLASFSVAEVLTGHNFQYVFRMAPSARIMAEQFANVAASLGYRKMVILYGRSNIDREVAFLFEDAAIGQGIRLVKRVSFFDKETNYRPIISQFSNEDFDAVFITASGTSAGVMARQLREMGVRQPILGSSSLTHVDYSDSAGKAADNTIVPTLYRANPSNEANREFAKRYQEQYRKPPGQGAAQGYDSVMLLATGIERAGSILPPLLSSTLHYMPAWVGVTGIHAFDKMGELLGKRYLFSVWRDGQLHELPAIHVPYLLQRFAKFVRKQYGIETIDFAKQFGKRMHDDDHKLYLLRLVYELLRFQRIGVIYENTKQGRKAADFALIKTLAAEKDIELIDCKIPFSLFDKTEVAQAMIDCYGKLSLQTDVLFITNYPNTDPKLVQQLNSGLGFYKIPAIALDQRNTDSYISVLLTKRSDINLQNTEKMRVYNGLLRNMKVHELAEQLQGLPEISVNLANLQHAGLPDRPLLELSPDHYRDTNGLFSPRGRQP